MLRLENFENREEQWIATRRALHQHAEVGFELPETRTIIKARLDELGLQYEENLGGIMGTLGPSDADETLLLRADMDALPMREESGLPFASQTDCAHCCGHDIHATVLLATLEILVEQVDVLNKQIIFLFQSFEEGGKGAEQALKAPLFQRVHPDRAFALHVDAKQPIGQIHYGLGKTFASNDSFTITLEGQSGHGARSFEAIDALNGAVQIYNGLKTMVQNELNVFEHNIFAITSLKTEESYNIIPGKAWMNGSLRTYDEGQRKHALERIETIVNGYSQALNLKVSMDYANSIPGVTTDKAYTEAILKRIEEQLPELIIADESVVKLGSEDFAYIAQAYPQCAYIFIGAGPNEREGYHVGQHNTKVVFNENAIAIGVKCMLQVVMLT